MLVSWEWLSQYVDIDIDHEQMATRWALTGLNHESTTLFAGDPVIDLEITSNRGDCLGHIGIAREASVLLNKPLRVPSPKLNESSENVNKYLTIENRFQDACPRYIGRLIRGVKIGPSPAWLQRRLQAIGVKPINNVVDATNYVMFECGQPLHAFDFAKIRGGKIIVRPAENKENFQAIDHRNYVLDPQMVVIADAEHAVALGGVMGGVDSEVSESTVDVLLESAEFVPLSIRRTARKLKLHSPSSYRYERRVDRAQLDWASARCCELILQIAGGTLLSGSVDTGAEPVARPEILLRRDRISKVLGIEVPWKRSIEILSQLGCTVSNETPDASITVVAPTYRSDLTREIDLIEEIARIHGYDQIPEDASVPMVASARRPKDVVMQTVRNVACAGGFDEALTPSLIAKSACSNISPWCENDAMSTMVPLLEGANLLRRSLVPSLIAARIYNQLQSNRDVQLFETANVYLPSAGKLPSEQFTLGMIAASDIRNIAGVFEEIILRCCGEEYVNDRIKRDLVNWAFLDERSGISWSLEGKQLAWIGQLNRSVSDAMKIDGKVILGELDLDHLLTHSRLVPQLQPVIPFPTIQRDLNLIVGEETLWSQMKSVISNAAGALCIAIQFHEIYRDAQKDGAGKKRVLLSLKLRSSTETLTSDRADEVIRNVVDACRKEFGATLLAGN